MNENKFTKVFRPGGSLELADAYEFTRNHRKEISKKQMVEKLINLGGKLFNSSGRMEGVHMVSIEEMMEEATVLIECATRIEWSSHLPLLEFKRNLNIEDTDILESLVGFDQSFTFAIAICVSTFSGSFPCYGMSKIMLQNLPNIEKAYKSGGVIGHADMGVVVVSGMSKRSLI